MTMSLEFLKDNLEKIEETIIDCCQQAGRDVDTVKLLAVTKLQPLEKLRALYALGKKSFGENKVQELCDKAAALPGDIEWHLVGSLQSNKVRQALKFASWIHSVDSLKLIKRIERIAGEERRQPNIFLQVNLSGEKQKGGFKPEELEDALTCATNCKNLNLVGLMTMAKAGAPAHETLNLFKSLKKWQLELRVTFPQVKEISMGMSGDFNLAILAGATYIRIGSLLLGTRKYK